MGHPLRWFLPTIVYEVTTRTMQERFLLRPSPEAREIILGVLGRGLVLYPHVNLHAFIYLSNHVHMLLSSRDGEDFSGFIGYVNGRVAFEMGRMHGWRGHFWGRRGRPIAVIDDDAQIGRLRYLIAQGCKEGLVITPRDWPGASSLPGLLGDMEMQGWWFDRDQERRARARNDRPGRYDHAIRYPVRLTPLPALAHLPPDELRVRHERLVAEVEEETRQRYEDEGGRPLGVPAVLAQDPLDRPAASKRSPAPMCHASTAPIRSAFRAAYRTFVDAYRRAAETLRTLKPGAPLPAFPAGSFPPRSRSVAYAPPAWPPWIGRDITLGRRPSALAPS